jgi:predicted DNA-binding transcriptional regulator YafY
MGNKDRLLELLQILQDNTDNEKWMTTGEIRAALEARGCDGSIRTLRKNVKALQDAGYKIGIAEKNGLPTEYAFLGRKWLKPELQILVDAVSAAQFIPRQRSEELIRKLSVMAGPSHTEELVPRILVSERVKAKNNVMILTVESIRNAIEKNRKITFQYLQYNREKNQVPKHANTPDQDYVVSPYATVWNNDRYYLVGWSDKRQCVAVYRIDRMTKTKMAKGKRVPAPEDFDVRDYTDKVFRMYGGPEEKVTLRCNLEILDQVIDRFGEGIELKSVTGHHFLVTVPVSLSTTFYAWVFQFVGKMSILAPEHVRESYAGYLEQALDDVLGEGS